MRIDTGVYVVVSRISNSESPRFVSPGGGPVFVGGGRFIVRDLFCVFMGLLLSAGGIFRLSSLSPFLVDNTM